MPFSAKQTLCYSKFLSFILCHSSLPLLNPQILMEKTHFINESYKLTYYDQWKTPNQLS